MTRTSSRHHCVVVLVALSVLLSAGCSTEEGPGVSEEAMRYNILGTAQLGQTKWVEAETEFRRALALRPQDPLLLTNTAIAVYQQQRADEATALLEQAVAADPQYLAAHFHLGLVESRNGDFEPAAAHFRVVVDSDAHEQFARYYLGTSLARVGREAEAVESLRAALALDPHHVSTLYALGRLLLQRGEQDEGLELITLSQKIRDRSGLDEAVGGEYAEQGPYSRAADYPGEALEAPPGIPVSFTRMLGVKLERGSRSITWTALPLADGSDPLFLVAQRAEVLQFLPPGRSAPVVVSAVEGAVIASLSAGDTDNDGRIDLAALLLVRTKGAGETLMPALFLQGDDEAFSAPPPTESFSGEVATPLESGAAGCDLALLDRDHDGDLDLFWCWTAAGDAGSGCKLATNDGAGRFEVRASEDHGFGFSFARPGPVRVAFSDVDNDRDIDLLVAEPGGVHLFANLRDGNFDDVSESQGLGAVVSRASSVVPADMNKDGWMDLVVSRGGPQLLLNRHGRFEPPVPLGGGQPGTGSTDAIILDFDNDGFLDVAASDSAGPFVLHNRGAGRWERRSDLLAIEGLAAGSTPLAALDVDGDGDLDAVVSDGAGGVSLLSNEGGNANHWIDLASDGAGDNRFGIGTKIEVLAGALRQKFEVTRPLPVHAGLGSRARVQAVRYLWPSGVLQDEVDLAAGKTTRITKLDRKGTSCPLLYAWRDGRWRFVTDFLGGSAVGYQKARGVFSVPDTDEYVRIEGGLSEDESGELRLRVNNQLEEVIWFDHIELVVVEHPRGTEVFPNERLMPGPPYPGFALFAGSDVRPVVSARGVESGHDLSAALRASDRSFVDDFERLGPKGYAAPHTLELDLGPFPAGRRVALLLDGWIDYADSTANIAASQAGLQLAPPGLVVADGRGGWMDVAQGVMGFPAGLPKTMLVDLTGLFPTADHRLRIGTSMRIYWDRARVMVGGEDTPLRIRRMPPLRAELGFGGYPRPASPDGRRPFAYDPHDVAGTYPWKAHVGLYTGFGDVTPLLDAIDDRFVTTRSGDEILLRFASPGPVRPGYSRTYLLYADGFGKDMDPNSAASAKVGPIPFHGMPVYPYPVGVVPPGARAANGPAPRRVTPSTRGWPGAPPFGLHVSNN